MGPFRLNMSLRIIAYLITTCVIGMNLFFALNLIVNIRQLSCLVFKIN